MSFSHQVQYIAEWRAAKFETLTESQMMFSPEKLESILPRWVTTLWHSPVRRYALLAPTVLSALAGLHEMGDIAEALTKAWLPILSKTRLILGEIFNFGGDALPVVLFFAPFSIAGIIKFNERPGTTVNIFKLIAAILAYAIVIGCALLPPPMAAPTFADYLGDIGAWLIYLLLPLGIVSAIFRRRDIPLEALPFTISALVLIFYFFATHSPFDHILDFAIVVAMIAAPFFNPDRLIDAAALMLGIILISSISKIFSPLFE